MAFVKGLARKRAGDEVILALNEALVNGIDDVREQFRELLPNDCIKVWSSPSHLCLAHGGSSGKKVAAEIIRSTFFKNLNADRIHISSIFEGFGCDAVTTSARSISLPPLSATLYDLIPLSNPKTYLDPSKAYSSFYEEKVAELKRCDLLLAISEFSKRRASEILAYPDEQIVSIGAATEFGSEAVQNQKLSLSQDELSYLGRIVAKPYLLYTGGADPRKNLGCLIDAYAQLPGDLLTELQLVICGKIPPKELHELSRRAKQARCRKEQVVFTGFVSDAALHKLYSECSLFVMPSLEEGFGLPALEAMACGAPVIAGNNSSLPEVVSSEDALFDASSPADLRDKILAVLKDEQLRNSLKEHGLKQAKTFSWDLTAEKAWCAFRALNLKAGALSTPYRCLSASDVCDSLVASTDVRELTLKHVEEVARCVDQNFPAPDRIPRLFVDISELIQRDAGTGVQRVTRSILNVLISDGVEGFRVNPVYATLESPGFRFAGENVGKFGFKSDGEPSGALIDVQPGDVFLGLDLQHHVVDSQMEFLCFMKRMGVSVNFVVYDLLPIQFPDFFPIGSAEGHQKWLEQVVSFDGAFCISKSVADELTLWMECNTPARLGRCRVEWFHLGSDVEKVMASKGLPPNASDTLKALKQRPTFLMVGTVEPRKGHKEVLASFEQLWQNQTDVNLCIVGKEGWRMSEFIGTITKHPELGERLVWIPDATDEYLKLIYANSSCLIAASHGEGFGLPLIEARQYNIPVLARDLPVFREVAGEAAVFFDHNTPQAIENCVKQYLSGHDHQYRSSSTISCLTWEQSAAALRHKLLH